VKLKDRVVTKKLERWQRIADSAMKQSGRSWRCAILRPLPVVEAVSQYGEGAAVIVADETETGIHEHGLKPGQPHFGLVGPEGAFSSREKDWLQEYGARRLSLGPFRLRAETAAITLAAALNQGRTHG
jgi:16S rRNA (uracil1498-N3)-methyltransferase